MQDSQRPDNHENSQVDGDMENSQRPDDHENSQEDGDREDSQRPDDHENTQVDEDMEIRPLGEQRPQRRGVEINNHRYVPPNRQLNDEENNEAPNDPRRNRLSIPLAVMAEESLQLQRKQNALLGELVHLFRNFRNEH